MTGAIAGCNFFVKLDKMARTAAMLWAYNSAQFCGVFRALVVTIPLARRCRVAVF
jgi:hypothetical protein